MIATSIKMMAPDLYPVCNYEAKAAENVAALESCYFTVTVKDNISGLSETVRLWLVSSVSGVSLSKAELEF